MRTSTKGINLIKQYERCRLTAYKDSVGIWTIGYGHTSGVKQGDTCTADQAESYFKSDLRTAENAINTMGVELTQNQFDALVSFVFNLGVGNFKSSTLYKKIKANPNDPTISDEFSKWKYAGGKELTGLLNRRNAESGLYFA
ncbi:MAG: lysozyme [Bacteroidia bacterium]|nr:lysozyme [Bacteroidia bacterium]